MKAQTGFFDSIKVKEMKTEYFVVCEKVITDVSGKNSLINIFENVNTATLPTQLPPFCFAAKVVLPGLEGQKARFELAAVNPKGEHRVMIANFEMPVKSERMHINLFVEGMNFEFFGTYTYHLNLLGSGEPTNLGETTIEVKEQQAAPAVVN